MQRATRGGRLRHTLGIGDFQKRGLFAMHEYTLRDLRIGQAGRIGALRSGCAMRRRLLDLGFTSEAPVSCLFESPAGDPRAYDVCGAVIALRGEDARDVLLDGGEEP